jgi:hypothetical protein
MSQPTEQTVSIQQVYADAMLNQIAEQRNQAQNQIAALTGQVRVLEPVAGMPGLRHPVPSQGLPASPDRHLVRPGHSSAAAL